VLPGAARYLGGHDDLLAGQSHWPTEIFVGGINVVNVGGTYTDKKLKVLELPWSRGMGVPPVFRLFGFVLSLFAFEDRAMNKFASWIVLAVAGLALAPAGMAQEQLTSRVTPVVLAYRRAKPSVVNISSEKIVTASIGPFGGAFEDIFPSPLRREVAVQSLGSGFIVHPAGYIVTNAHVVSRATKIAVTLSDNSKYPARVISADPDHDLAVLKIEPPKGVSLPHLPLGRSDDLMVGETVLAVGNPMGLSHTVTGGIVSALDRELEFAQGVKYTGLIQTDAPINPGSSGGPLLNVRGELVGINTAIRADAQNIGFAIPVDKLMELFPMLLNFERINRADFGATVQQRHGPAGDELRVTAIRAGGPADGKLKVGDRLRALNGRGLAQVPDFTCEMLALGAPAKAYLECQRDGKAVNVTVDILAKPKPNGNLLARKLFGMTLKEVTPESARELRLPMDHGLMVVGIDGASPAELIGLRLKDVVFQVGTAYVVDMESLGVILEEAAAGQAVRIGVARGNVATWVNIRAQSPPAGTAPATPHAAPTSEPRAAPKAGAVGTNA